MTDLDRARETFSRSQLEASEWVYSGEGGKHVVFAPSKQARHQFNVILRVSKEDLWVASLGIPSTVDMPSVEPSSYLTQIIKPTFNDFIDIPQNNIFLDWTFLRSLRERTIASGAIPEHRLSSWSFNYTLQYRKQCATGQLCLDYRFPLANNIPTSTHFISFEIKPKAGYIAFSPLVKEDRRIKLKYSRFQLQQCIKANDARAKGKPFKLSRYDPRDLFSGTKERIRQALSELQRSPQNNMRAWLDRTRLDFKKIDCSDGLVHTAFQLLEDVLFESPVLNNILDIQKLDIIDADGAIVVYERLVQLSDGDYEEAERKIDTIEFGVPTRIDHELLRASPFRIESSLTEVMKLCDEISGRRTDRTAGRESLVSLVKNLQSADCVYLLQNWLLSLAMSDCSIFVSFSFTENGILSPDSSTIRLIDCDAKPARKLRARHLKEEFYENIEIFKAILN